MNDTKQKTAIIIGAGPAGLTAAYELLIKTDIKPIIYEASGDIGGISKTVNYKGNRIDIGGHRFFSKSDRVMRWWQNILPIQNQEENNPDKTDKIMLIRNRVSRIFFLRKFFDYPLSLNFNTLKNLGAFKIFQIFFSYTRTRLFPIKKEKSLEDFFINRFGEKLYLTFFKDYTEKLWGVPPRLIKPEWGAQRIKGLSISKAISHALKNLRPRTKNIEQKKTETSLIEKFLYPKYGPGQMWEEVARLIKEKGGEIHLHHEVYGLKIGQNKIVEIIARNKKNGGINNQKGDYFFSTMPVKNLIRAFEENIHPQVRKVAEGLIYRDFITVGLLLKKLKIANRSGKLADNWIYVQERDVKVGRIQIFNNWSPYLVSDENTVWLGLEYFCNEGDQFWNKSDAELKQATVEELLKMGFIDRSDVLDGCVIRMPKTYPAYFGTYDQFHVIRNFVDQFENLFLIGRNGMHKYNNQDHSMLTAMIAVENIINKIADKDNIWSVNAEQEYHEENV